MAAVRVPSFNKQPFTLELVGYDKRDLHHLETEGGLGSIFISNTAKCAQTSALAALRRNEPAICFHSKITPCEKDAVLKQVRGNFGKDSASESMTLYAGPLVQASLNIQTWELNTEPTTAENLLQRIGRGDRWGALLGAVVRVYCPYDRDENLTIPSNLQLLGSASRAAVFLRYL